MNNFVEITFLEVGHGDSIVILYPDKQTAMVIDTPDARITYDYLIERGVKAIDWLIISHGDIDHYKGILQLIANLSEVGIVISKLGYIRGDKRITSEGSYRRLRKQFVELEDKLGVDTPPPCANVLPTFASQDGMEIHCLYPKTQADIESAGDDTNDWSIVLMMEYLGKKALLSADLEGHGWFRLNKKTNANNMSLKADVFKIPHHGRWFDGGKQKLSSADAATLVDAKIGIISAGYHKKESPAKVIKYLKEYHSDMRLLCTGCTLACHDRTSVLSESEDSKNSIACAGTITVTFSNGGITVVPNQNDHNLGKSNLTHPLCS